MNYSEKKSLYEQFHEVTKSHNSIITDKDYTHGYILNILKEYITEDMKVLDIGCGTGTISFYLSKRVKSVKGIDISEKAIKSCKQNKKALKVKNASFEVSTVEDFQSKKKYDLVCLLEVIEHLEDDAGSLKKISDLLNSDGLLVLSTPSLNAPLYKLGLLDNFDKRVGHLRRYTLDSICKIMEDNGFKVIYKEKTEGIVRNTIFNIKQFNFLLRLINKFTVIAQFFLYLDKLTLRLGESDLVVVGAKK